MSKNIGVLRSELKELKEECERISREGCTARNVKLLSKCISEVRKKEIALRRLYMKHGINCEVCNDLIAPKIHIDNIYEFCSYKCKGSFIKSMNESSEQE